MLALWCISEVTFFDFPSAQYDVDEISGVRLSCRPVFVSADLSSAPYWANDPIPVSHLYFQHNTDNCVLVKSSSDIAINQSWKWLIEENKNSTVARRNPELRLCEHHHSVNWSHEINFFTNNILTTKEKIPYKHLTDLTDLTLRTATFSTTDIVFPLLIFLS